MKNYIENHGNISTLIFSTIIAIIVFSLYYKTIDFDLVYCDDNIFVHDDKQFNSDIENLPKCFNKTFGTSYYRPVLGMSFVLDYYYGSKSNDPLNPYYYQLTNNIFHALGSALVFIFLIFLGYDKLKSFIFGLIFAVHPILTPASSWISGRNDSMITIFILLSFIFLIKYLDIKSPYRYLLLLFQLLFYTTALYTKEVAAVTPIVFIIYLYFFRKEKFLRKDNILLISLWFIIGLFWFAQRYSVLKNIQNPDDISISAFIKNLPSVPDMVGKIFLPIHNLPLPSLDTFSIITGIIAILILLYLVFNIKGNKKRYSIIGLSWFSIFLAPTLMIRILNVGDFFDYAEHRAYLPMVGIFLLIMELLKAKKVDFYKPIPLIISAIIIVSFAMKSYYYQNIFDGRKNFWQHKVDKEPNVARGYMDLSLAYFQSGEYEIAEELNYKGMKLNPNNSSFYLNLSAIYLKKNQLPKAEEFARKSVELSPNNKNSRFSLGNILYSQKKYNEAIPELLTAVKLSGQNPNIIWVIKLAVSYHNNADPKNAIKYYNYVLSKQPKNYDLIVNYGIVHMNAKEYIKARNVFINAINMYPNKNDAYNHLIRCYMILNSKQEALDLVEKATNLKIHLDKKLIEKLNSN